MSIPLNRSYDETIGAYFISRSGGALIFKANRSDSLYESFSAAAVFDEDSLKNISNLNLFLLERPSDTRLFNDSKNRTVVSPVIIASPQIINNSSANITLYFTNEAQELANKNNNEFFCVYFDTNTSSWNNSGCTKPKYNDNHKRYECNCSHLTSFGLMWLPPGSVNSSSESSDLRPVDIFSLVAQFISIGCFLALIIHNIVTRINNPHTKFQSIHLFPMISSGITVLLFIFYIALVLTVYMKARSLETEICFTSATVLMFFAYFFMILTFGAKTSVVYFYYTRYVRLFPPPSRKTLTIPLIISFIIAILAVAIGIGFSSTLSSGIITIHRKKICWFDRNVIHYFMTIPTGIFLLINIYLFIRIAKRMINHSRNATSPHKTYELMKRCVLFLVFSSISQGIGWITGPLLTILNSNIGEVVEWIFDICNALEGLWSILLYIIILQQHIDEEKRVKAVKDLKKVKILTIIKDKQRNSDNKQIKTNSKQRKCQIIYRSPRNDLYRLGDFSYKIKLDSTTDKYYA
jgi:hypothetical protein